MRITPVIMSGGAGTRLWPLSTAATPKQFHALASANTLLQETALRVASKAGEPFQPAMVVANAMHRAMVERQIADAGLVLSRLVLEPFGRDTAAVAAIAAKLCEADDSLVLLLSADHMVRDPEAFRAAVLRAAPIAAERIVTFGVTPSGPETGYGYIQRGAVLCDGVFEVLRFAEKPTDALARDYLASGDYAWNAGYFLFSPAVMLREMRAARPDILDGALAALAASDASRTVLLDAATFAACPSESIDFAVMEHTKFAAVAPCDIGWADIGSWSELWRLGDPDAAGNVLHGDAHSIDSQGALFWAEDVSVTVLGVEGLIVVATPESVIVLPKARAQEVKRIAAAHRARKAAAEGRG